MAIQIWTGAVPAVLQVVTDAVPLDAWKDANMIYPYPVSSIDYTLGNGCDIARDRRHPGPSQRLPDVVGDTTQAGGAVAILAAKCSSFLVTLRKTWIRH